MDHSFNPLNGAYCIYARLSLIDDNNANLQPLSFQCPFRSPVVRGQPGAQPPPFGRRKIFEQLTLTTAENVSGMRSSHVGLCRS